MKRAMAMALTLLLGTSVAACNETMSDGQKGAVTGAALGAGVGLVSGGSFGEVVGASLIGGSLGYIVAK